MGGLLTLESFITQFPDLDTSSDAFKAMSSSAQMHRSNIQGRSFAEDILEGISKLTGCRCCGLCLQCRVFRRFDSLYLYW